MEPIKARFPGVCARTGQSYEAGALIVKLSGGKWALAQDRTGKVKVAPAAAPAPDYRVVRLPGGTLKHHVDVNRTLYCGDCLKEANLYEAAQSNPNLLPPYILTRTGDDFTCIRCPRVIHILNEEEIWQEVTLPVLHFEGSVLSHKVGPARWEKIKQYFEYHSYRDLAERYDEEDEFDRSEDYRRMGSGGEWWLKHGAKMEEVEEILGILPENRYAVRSVRIEAEQKAERDAARLAAEEKREQDRLRRQLFDPRQGEYVKRGPDFDGHVRGVRVPVGAGFNIYGGGEELVIDDDGAHVWLLENNGMDGDDWSRNNVTTGGAGAVGYRFPRTPERFELLCRMKPDVRETVRMTRDEERAAFLRDTQAAMLADAREPLPALLTEAPIDANNPPPCVWVWLGGKRVGMPLDRSVVCVRAPYLGEQLQRMMRCGFDCSDNVSCVYLHYPPIPALVEGIAAMLPDWVGTDRPGRYKINSNWGVYVATNAADALRCTTVWKTAIQQVEVKEGVELLSLEPNSGLCLWSDGVATTGKLYHTAWDRETNRRYYAAKGQEPPAPFVRDWHGMPEPPTSLPNTEGVSPVAASLVRTAIGSPLWREGGRWRELLTVVEMTANGVSKREQRGSAVTLDRLTLTHADKSETLLWRVHGEWWYMGEDGDAGDDTYLFPDEAESLARTEYDTLYRA